MNSSNPVPYKDEITIRIRDTARASIGMGMMSSEPGNTIDRNGTFIGSVHIDIIE
jgi:hypothetical protein